MSRDLTYAEKKVLSVLFLRLYGVEDAAEIETFNDWFVPPVDEDRAKNIIEYFSQDPEFPVKSTPDGKIYLDPSLDLHKWINNIHNLEDIDEASEEELREIIYEIQETNEELLQELKDERERAERFREEVEEYRENTKRLTIASILITFTSFLLGILTGLGFL